MMNSFDESYFKLTFFNVTPLIISSLYNSRCSTLQELNFARDEQPLYLDKKA